MEREVETVDENLDLEKVEYEREIKRGKTRKLRTSTHT